MKPAQAGATRGNARVGRRDAVDLLARLVACPSVNPAAAAGNAAWSGEARMTDLLADLLGGWGAAIRRQPVLPGRANLIATFRGRDPGRSLLFEAHSDTVGLGRAGDALLRPVVRRGRLHGRGACDTKGPMAAMLLAIRASLDADGRPPVTLHFVSTCDEEGGAQGAAHLVRSGFRASAAVVGEPTGLAVICAHKGAVRFRLVVRGKAAHSSTPERGVNAIYRMGRVLAVLEHDVARALQARPHPLLGAPTISVGTIRGGVLVNVVPDRCEIEVDRRLVPGEDLRTAVRELRAALAPLETQPPGFRVRIETTQYYPVLDGRPDAPIAALAASACERVLGRVCREGAPYATNAGFFAQAGIPCVVFGPGSIRQAHTDEEFIDLDEWRASIGVYAAMIRAAPTLP